MKTQKRQKLCVNCNGSVDLDVLICPYCGHDLLMEKKEDIEDSLYQPAGRHLTPNQTIASLYPPAYSPHQEEEQSRASFTPNHHYDPNAVRDPFDQTVDEKEPKKEIGSFLPILVFSLGAFLAALGLFIFFFSTNGYAILKWNAKYWFIYLLTALPLLIWGYRLLGRLDVSEEDLDEDMEEPFEDEEYE